MVKWQTDLEFHNSLRKLKTHGDLKRKRNAESFRKYSGVFKEDYEFVEWSWDLDKFNSKFVNGIYK